MRYLEIMIRLASKTRQLDVSVTPFFWQFTFQADNTEDWRFSKKWYLSLGPIAIDYERRTN